MDRLPLKMNTCEYCDCTFTEKRSLKRHYTRCKEKEKQAQEQQNQELVRRFEQQLNDQEKHTQHLIQQFQEREKQYQEQIEKLELQNKELRDQMFEIAKQPTTTQTQNTRNIQIINQLAPYDLTKEQITELVDQHFDVDTFQGGPEEITKLTALLVLTDSETQKPKVTCTDLSRKNFRYLDLHQKIQVDPGFQKTHDLIRNPLFQANLRVFTKKLECADKHIDQWRKNSNFIEDRFEFSGKLLKFMT
jgi:hypothetical protein